MDIEELKSTWNSVSFSSKSADDIRLMLRQNKHPVLRKIRLQFTIEITGWLLFLLFYYTGFDGGHKPLLINIAFASSIFLVVLHNMLGFRLSRYLIHGVNLKKSVDIYLLKVKRYAIVSIASRAVLMVGIILFFTYGLHFTLSKYISIVIIVCIFIIQLTILINLWIGRLKHLNNVTVSFE